MLAAAFSNSPAHCISSIHTSNTTFDNINTLCNALTQTGQLCQSHSSTLSTLIRDAINHVEDNDNYKCEIIQQVIPLLVSSNTLHQDNMALRYAMILCSKVVGRSNCIQLASASGFVAFIQQAISNTHISISRPACDTMMKMIAYSPEPKCILCNNELTIAVVVQTAMKNISPNADSNKCLDALRVIMLMKQNDTITPDDKLCDCLVETFYDNTTPFVSKQTASLILLLIEDDDDFKKIVCQTLTQRSQPNKPIQAAKCWKEVNDVIGLVC